jgi:hypothetical protein
MMFFSFLSFDLLICLFFASPVYPKVIGTVGKTYPIVEPDALTEIEASAAKINMA